MSLYLEVLFSSHGMSYPVSGQVKGLGYKSKDYDQDKELVVGRDPRFYPIQVLGGSY